jgi:hypothetical protein
LSHEYILDFLSSQGHPSVSEHLDALVQPNFLSPPLTACWRMQCLKKKSEK